MIIRGYKPIDGKIKENKAIRNGIMLVNYKMFKHD